MSLIQAKQVSKFLIAPIYISGIAIAATSNSVSMTSALTTALAGLPVQVANSVPADPQGVVSAGNNIAAVWVTGSKSKLFTPAGDEVYARLTQAAGVYTASFFSLAAGVETAFTFVGASTVDVVPLYQYSFANLPADALVTVPERYVDPSQAGGTRIREVLAVTAANVLAAVSQSPNVAKGVLLYVNGQIVDALGGTPSFTVAGATVTWSSANNGYNLATTDRVVVDYSL